MSKKINTQSAEAAAASPLMYCGPNIPGVASQGLLFTDPPPLLREHMEKCPALGTLIISPREYGRVRQAIARKGSLESTQYRKALEYLQKGE